MNEFRVDMRQTSQEEIQRAKHYAQLIFTLNHTMPFTDEYNHILKEIFGSRLGAGATITACVTIGRYAIVGAASVVTHNVGDYEVVVGNPARVIKTLDAGKFDEKQRSLNGVCLTKAMPVKLS